MSGDRFLGRWSRMKSRARGPTPVREREATPSSDRGAWQRPVEEDGQADKRPAPKAVAAVELDVELDQAAAVEEDTPQDDASILADWPEDLPHPDDLTSQSDYSAFFSPDVKEAVRNLALRRLWRSNPVLANVDGLVDYGEDFTDAATVIANMKSAYQVGRGYARDEPEEVAGDVEEADAADEAAVSADADTPDADEGRAAEGEVAEGDVAEGDVAQSDDAPNEPERGEPERGEGAESADDTQRDGVKT